MKSYSPIVLFIYKRATHLEKTLLSLLRCENLEKHSIYVFGDGARFESENAAVLETRLMALRKLSTNTDS